MREEDLKKIMEKQFERCRIVMLGKSVEYTEGSDDKLEHFRAAAALMGVTPEAALMGMMSKHLVSVADMCMDQRGSGAYGIGRWDEKITDSINYLLLLRAIVEETRTMSWEEVEEAARHEGEI